MISTAHRRTILRSLLAAIALSVAGGSLALPLAAAELLMFEEAGCPWCARWHAEVGPGYPNSSEGRIAPLRRLDIRAQRSANVTLASPVRATPTFVLVDNGREVGRITGYPGADFFWGLLEGLIKRLPPARPAPAQQQAI